MKPIDYKVRLLLRADSVIVPTSAFLQFVRDGKSSKAEDLLNFIKKDLRIKQYLLWDYSKERATRILTVSATFVHSPRSELSRILQQGKALESPMVVLEKGKCSEV